MVDESSELFDLRTFVRSAWQRKFLIIGIMIGCMGLAGALAAIKTPKYRAEVLLTAADDRSANSLAAGLSGQFGGLAALAGVNLGRNGSLEEALATIVSNTVLEEFIAKNDLLKVILYKRWDAKKGEWKHGPLGGGREPTLWDAADEFRRSVVTVAEDKKTHLVRLFIYCKNP